ncbi:MAG: His/Gly/Thr/Pro-type tRNA ligase C-terminal domain-containing protein [Parcubacteria group bacterium]
MIASGIQLNKRLNEFDKPLVIASYFGFSPIMAPKVTDEDLKSTSHCSPHPHFDASEKAALIRTYLEENFSSLSHPLAISYKRSVPKKKSDHYSLHLIGSGSGIAEATLMRTALSVLSEEGYKNLRIDINCVGDKESISAYERELSGHVKKFHQELPLEAKEHLKEDVFNIFKSQMPEILSIRQTAPSSITSLTYQSRIHFKEVLEYVDGLGIEFRISPELVGERNHASHTIFAVKEKDNDDEEENTLAVGYRYSRLGRRLGLKKDLPMAGVTIFTPQKEQTKIYKNLPKPRFYIVQLGREAMTKTISLIELLRLNRIPAYHYLGKDKLSFQLTNAENLSVSHLIIIGQKEALENTATVRNIHTRAQDTISIQNLPHYLRNMPI